VQTFSGACIFTPGACISVQKPQRKNVFIYAMDYNEKRKENIPFHSI